MLIVISSPVPLPQEARWINALFDAGLERLHLRRPGREYREVQALIRGIHPGYYDRIACHHHHKAAMDTGMRRLHFTELMRQQVDAKDLLALGEQGIILSTSIHTLADYPILSQQFDYTFVGPVFDSLSKEDYRATPGLLDAVKAQRTTTVKRIALGGIDATSCSDLAASGFDGIGVLGAIWRNPDPVICFKIIHEAWHTAALSY